LQANWIKASLTDGIVIWSSNGVLQIMQLPTRIVVGFTPLFALEEGIDASDNKPPSVWHQNKSKLGSKKLRRPIPQLLDGIQLTSQE